MHIENGKIIFGRKKCISCQGKGETVERIACTHYGKTVRGRFPNGVCPECGAKNKHSHRYLETGNMIVCWSCEGKGDVAEDRFSHVTTETMKQIIEIVPLIVIKGPKREISMNESLLGIGLIVGITDYRDWTVADPEELIDVVRTQILNDTSQALNYCDKEENLCNAIGISPHTSGWSARPIFEEADKLAAYLEIGESAGMLRRGIIAASGGNGTTAICR